ncbi:hypothetical protein [uncultured Tessaracoccus sp.]|uniref:hypothetical protein n=1 Tax=uncultured Tessaracoccus sp. TaxID=905023 RepID=UPI0026286A5B|nr:hypothetical protein [uncultured Tessaracoccus sp.]
MRYQTNGELLDVLEEGTDALMLVDDRLVRGSVVTVDILWLCSTPRTIDELAAHCLEAFGAPPGRTIEEATLAAVRSLIDVKALREVP